MVHKNTIISIMVLLAITAANGDAPAGCLCYKGDGYGLSPCTTQGCAIGGSGNYGVTSAGYGGNNAGTYCHGNTAEHPDRGFAHAPEHCSGAANAECCNFCCETHSLCATDTVCHETDAACSAHSAAAGGHYTTNVHGGTSSNGYTYYKYFSELAGTYCPVSGSQHYSDCAAACIGDVDVVSCVRCCGACCHTSHPSRRRLLEKWLFNKQ